MNEMECAAAFARAHDMHPQQMDFETVRQSFLAEMERGARGESSSLGMFPAYLRGSGALRRNTPVLVIDAGGTNLRAARMRYTDGGMVTEELRRGRMPGTRGEIPAEEMFRAIAELALPLSEGCERASFCFSYPCEVLPDGDGRMIRLTKELHVRGLEGSLLCAPLEAALRALGARGTRRWRLLNDTVGSLLGGMVQCADARYADYIGFILGTGTNTCCSLRADMFTKAPAAAAMGGDILVNLESGGFSRFPRGDADRLLDAASEKPGAQWAEKAISGAYLPALLRQSLELAVTDGWLAAETGERLRGAALGMAELDRLCVEAAPDDPLAALLGAERPFVRELCVLLLERAAKLTAAILSGIITQRGIGAGQTVCICADGTTFRMNPLLRPRTQAYLRAGLTARCGAAAEFFEVRDATLLGSACASLLD